LEACSATWNLGTNSAYALVLRKTTENLNRVCRSQDLPDVPNLESQVPVFISPRNKVAQLCPQALSYHFVASYDSQGYGGGIVTRLHCDK
jgi:hypothetical protein